MGKYVKTFEEYNYPVSSYLTNRDYDSYLKTVYGHFSDPERSREDLDWYIETIHTLNKNGGIIYKLVFLDSKEDLDTNDIKEHWVLKKTDIENFFDTLKSEATGEQPFLITAKISKDSVDIKGSMAAYAALPHEVEVNINKKPEKYKLTPYKRPWE
jgi:hypothetical protein